MVDQTFLPNARRSTLHGPDLFRPQAAPRPLTTKPAAFSLPVVAPAFSAASITQVDPDTLARQIAFAPVPLAVPAAAKTTFGQSLSLKINDLKNRATAFIGRHPSLAYGAAALGFGAATLLPNTALASGGFSGVVSDVASGLSGAAAQAASHGLLWFGIGTLGLMAVKAVFNRYTQRGAHSIRRLATRFFLPLFGAMNAGGLALYATSFLVPASVPAYAPFLVLTGAAVAYTFIRIGITGLTGLISRRKGYVRAAYEQSGVKNRMLTEVISRKAQLGLGLYFAYRHCEVGAFSLGILLKFLYNLPALAAHPVLIATGAVVGLFLGNRTLKDFRQSTPLQRATLALAGGALGAMAGALGGHLLENFAFACLLLGIEDAGLPHSWVLNSGARKAENHRADDDTDRQIHEGSRARAAKPGERIDMLTTLKCSSNADNIVTSLFTMLLCGTGTYEAYIQHNTKGYGDTHSIAGLRFLRSQIEGLRLDVRTAWDIAAAPGSSWQTAVTALADLYENLGTQLIEKSPGDFARRAAGVPTLGNATFSGPEQSESRHFLGKLIKYSGHKLIQEGAALRLMAADADFPMDKIALKIAALTILDKLYRKFNAPLQFSPTFNFRNLFPIESMGDQKYHGTDMVWQITRFFGTATMVVRERPALIDRRALPTLAPALAGQDALLDRYFRPNDRNPNKLEPRASRMELTKQVNSDEALSPATKGALAGLIRKAFDEYLELIPLRVAKDLRPDFDSEAIWNVTSRPNEDNRQEWREQDVSKIGPYHGSDIFMIDATDHRNACLQAIADAKTDDERTRAEADYLEQFPTSDVIAAPVIPANRYRDVYFKNGSIRRVWGDGHTEVIAQSFRGPHGEPPQPPPDDIPWLPGTKPNPVFDFDDVIAEEGNRPGSDFNKIRNTKQPQILCFLKTRHGGLADEEQSPIKGADLKPTMTRDLDHNPVLMLQTEEEIALKVPFQPYMKENSTDEPYLFTEGPSYFYLRVTGKDGNKHIIPLNIPKTDKKVEEWKMIDRDRPVEIVPNGQPGCYDVTAFKKNGDPYAIPYPQLLYYLDELGLGKPEAELLTNDGNGPEAIVQVTMIRREPQKIDKKHMVRIDSSSQARTLVDQAYWDLHTRMPKEQDDYLAMDPAERVKWPWVDHSGLVHLPDGTTHPAPNADPSSSMLSWWAERDSLIAETTYNRFVNIEGGFMNFWVLGSEI